MASLLFTLSLARSACVFCLFICAAWGTCLDGARPIIPLPDIYTPRSKTSGLGSLAVRLGLAALALPLVPPCRSLRRVLRLSPSASLPATPPSGSELVQRLSRGSAGRIGPVKRRREAPVAAVGRCPHGRRGRHPDGALRCVARSPLATAQAGR